MVYYVIATNGSNAQIRRYPNQTDALELSL